MHTTNYVFGFKVLFPKLTSLSMSMLNARMAYIEMLGTTQISINKFCILPT